MVHLTLETALNSTSNIAKLFRCSCIHCTPTHLKYPAIRKTCRAVKKKKATTSQNKNRKSEVVKCFLFKIYFTHYTRMQITVNVYQMKLLAFIGTWPFGWNSSLRILLKFITFRRLWLLRYCQLYCRMRVCGASSNFM